MKKLLSLLATISIITTSSSVIACGGIPEVEEKNNEKIDLSSINNNLGEIKGSTNLPTLQLLVLSINEINENLELSEDDVRIDGSQTITSTKLVALENSLNFKGEVIITYNYEKVEKRDLSTLNGNLDILYGKDSKPSETEIINKFLLINNKEGIKSTDIRLKQNSLNEDLTEATIEANENSDLFVGSIDLTFKYSVATEVDLKLVNDLINGEGDYASMSPAVFKKGITANPDEINNKESMFNNIKTFTEKLLNLAKLLGINISFDQLNEMVDINYYSDDNGTILHEGNQKIKLIRITVKKGYELNIDGYYVKGVINAKVYEKIDITKIITDTDLGTLKVTSTSHQLYALRAVNEYLTNKYKDIMDENNITSDCWETINNKSFKYDDDSKLSATVTLPKEDTFNNIFYNSITLKFKIEKK
ncbi:hypothetical protein SCORR_v1c03060 [Spiroplasma corruscae]|uniref:Lipoprotein n=1 Tax=Spiroplasma corruscae TaxID=216934 RepID=A0A222ENK3_9MOLU|nr:hypothetical protein [Spiroplasma corruscae]ASP28080.1 hypothetical protein SCORR_v1c03060 [Spiroplasma corruscae]